MTARTSKVLKWVGFALLIAVVEFVMFCIMTFVNYKSLFRSGYMERTEFTSEETAIIQRGMYLLREEEIIEPLSLMTFYSSESSHPAYLLFSIKEGKEERFNEYIAAKYDLWHEYTKMEEKDPAEYDIWYNDIKYTVKEYTRMKDTDSVKIELYEAENGQILYLWETYRVDAEVYYDILKENDRAVKITPDQANGNRFPHKDYK